MHVQSLAQELAHGTGEAKKKKKKKAFVLKEFIDLGRQDPKQIIMM